MLSYQTVRDYERQVRKRAPDGHKSKRDGEKYKGMTGTLSVLHNDRAETEDSEPENNV
jgi:hypothetical protein